MTAEHRLKQIPEQHVAERGGSLGPVSVEERRFHSPGQIEAERYYSLVRVESVEFAYADHDLFIEALGQVWDAGLVPEPLPSVAGVRLREAAPNLAGIDVDLSDLRPDDVSPPAARA
jgi:hypothetical protein